MRAENISAKSTARRTKQAPANKKDLQQVVVAIPYYSQLVRQNGGLEHIYFKLGVNPITGEYSKPKLSIWNSKELPSLPEWLCQEGVNVLLCSDNRPGFEGLFAATGISIYWNQRGEVTEMVTRWIRSIPIEQTLYQHQTVFA